MSGLKRKKISNEEAASLGLSEASGVERRKISPDEFAAIPEGDAPSISTPPVAAKPSMGRAAAEGALQGGTYGFGDEIQGVLGAALRRSPGLGYPSRAEMGEENIFPGGNSFGDDYRMEREAARRDRTAAEKAHSTTFSASQLAAAMLSPGPKPGKTVGSFVKGGAKAGGLFGLGSSDADLTKGDVGGAALDTAIGTGIGAGAGVVAGLVNKPLQAGARKMTEIGQKAFARGAEKAQKPIDQAIRSDAASVGGNISAGSRTLEKLREAASDPSLPEEISRRAAELLQEEEAKLLNQGVVQGHIGQFYQRLPAIRGAQEKLGQSLEAGSPEARKAAVDAFMAKSPLKRALWEITKRVGPGVIGSGVGAALGGTAGAGVGGGLGLLAGAVTGNTGRIMRNAVSSPQFQRSAAQFGERALGEVAPGALLGTVGEQSGNEESMSRSALSKLLEEYGK